MNTTRRTLLKTSAAAAFVVAAGTGTAASAVSVPSTSDDGPDRHALREALREITRNGASAVLAEIRDSAWVWRGAAGRAELAASRPVAAHGRFRIGSVTKSFAATVVLQLEAERRLRLDDPLARWLPGVVPAANEITLRHLLQHTSGVPEYMERFYELYPTTADFVRQRFRRWTPRELLALVEGRPPRPSRQRRDGGRTLARPGRGIRVGALADGLGDARLRRARMIGLHGRHRSQAQSREQGCQHHVTHLVSSS